MVVRTYKNSTVIKLPGFRTLGIADIDRIADWCKQNTRGDIEFIPSGTFGLDVLFEVEEEAALFALRWR